MNSEVRALKSVVLVFENVGGDLDEEAVELSLVPLGEDVAHLLVAQVTRVLNRNIIYILDNNRFTKEPIRTFRTYSEILELVYLNLNIYCYKYILYNKKYPAIKEYQKNWSGISKTQ